MFSAFGVEHTYNISKMSGYGDENSSYNKVGYADNPNYGKQISPAKKGFLGIGKRPARRDTVKSHAVWEKTDRKSGTKTILNESDIHRGNETPYTGKYRKINRSISKMGPDQSSVHVNGPLKTVKNKVKRVNTGDARIPKEARTFLHGSVVRAYNESRDKKVRAAVKQAGGGALGGATGSLIGGTLVGLGAKRIGGLKNATKIGRYALSADKKQGMAIAAGAGTVGGMGSASGNYFTLKNTKKTKKYKFSGSGEYDD